MGRLKNMEAPSGLNDTENIRRFPVTTRSYGLVQMAADYRTFNCTLMMVDEFREVAKVKCQVHQTIWNNALRMFFTWVQAIF